jgi:hypothetical protein
MSPPGYLHPPRAGFYLGRRMSSYRGNAGRIVPSFHYGAAVLTIDVVRSRNHDIDDRNFVERATFARVGLLAQPKIFQPIQKSRQVAISLWAHANLPLENALARPNFFALQDFLLDHLFGAGEALPKNRGWPEHHDPARCDGHFLSSLWISALSRPLLSYHE